MAYALELRQNLDRLAVDMRAITALAEKEGKRGLTADEITKWQTMADGYELLEQSIQGLQGVIV